MRLIFDIETDGLLNQLRTLHCIVVIDADTNQVHEFPPSKLKDGLVFLSEADQLIGHNIMEFDIPAIKKLRPKWHPKGKIWDTLIMSRLLFPERDSHSLESWGYTLKNPKSKSPEKWDVYTDEMLSYCKQDVKLTRDLFNLIQRTESSSQAIDLEHEIHRICLYQTRCGIPFNDKEAQSLYAKLSTQRHHLEEKLKETFGSWWVSKGVQVPKVNNKTRGVTKGCEYEKIEQIEFNPRSRDHIARCLQQKYNWQPKLLTPKGKPRVDEEVMSMLEFPEAKLLEKYLVIQKRISQLAEGAQAWLKCSTKQGLIHGRVRTQGAVTARATHNHPNLAQVPSVRVPFGKECRELFYAPRNQVFVGADLSGLELRCLAHYMARFDGGEYTQKLLTGDIHTENQKAAGLETRDQAKTFIYGFLYGAGNYKVGQIVGKGAKAGGALRKKFLSQLPALKRLKDAVDERAKKGYILGLDGRKIPVRHQHAALNTLLQSAGAIICKEWVVMIDKLADDHMILGTQALWIHDEVQYLVNKGMEDRLGELMIQAAKEVAVKLKLRCPLDAEYKVGSTWADTH